MFNRKHLSMERKKSACMNRGERGMLYHALRVLRYRKHYIRTSLWFLSRVVYLPCNTHRHIIIENMFNAAPCSQINGTLHRL